MIQEQGQDRKISAVVQEQEQIGAISPSVQEHTTLLMRFCLISASSIALFYSLGEQLLRTWDESIYAEVAKEMLTQHSWWTLSWNFQPWVDKPPLFMWLTALLYRCFGVSETTSRTVGVLCGVATIWLTFEIGRRLIGDWGGFVAASILLTNGYFIYASRFEEINVPLTFSFTLAAYAYLRILQGEPRWWYTVGAATGVAIMLKSAAGLAVPMSVGLALLLDRRRFRTIITREVRNSALLACTIALPWHLSMVISHGRVFLNAYLGSVFARMRGVESVSRPAYFYLSVYWHDFGLVALVALLGLLLHFKGQRNSSIVISIVLVVTISFSLTGSKLMAYAIPAFPFISLLAAMAIQRVKTVKYMILWAVVIFPLYWFSQRNFVQLIYGDYGYVGSINSRDEPLMRLLVLARPSDHELSPAPLIICMDGFRFQKQQAVFYGDRPVSEAFLLVPINDTESPLEQVVSSRPAFIIIWNDQYPMLDSAKYNFRVIAQSGPLMLGQISRL
jgi:4-amino-4-deoxy-L-arabinose transferase-like glycosyltransferase